MQIKITQAVVDSLKSQAKPYAVRDTEIKGFMLRVRPNGGMTWFYDYRNKAGRRLTYKLGAYPALKAEGARRSARAAAGKVADRVDVQAEAKAARAEGERAKVATLGAFIDGRYEPWALQHMRRGDQAADRLKADFKAWLDKPMSEINTWLVVSWRRDRMKDKRDPEGKEVTGVAPATVNRQLDTLRACLRKAVQWGVLETHPLKDLKRVKSDDDERVRFLTEAEEKRLRAALMTREANLRTQRDSFNEWRTERGYKALPARSAHYVDHIRPIVLLAINTGLRRGEIFSLKWSDIDIDGAMLNVRAAAAKSGDARRVPLNTEALTTLQSWQKQTRGAGDALVFPGRSGARLDNITKGWVTVRKLAKLSDFRYHDLRHTFASKLVQKGIDLNTVRALMGHADLKMTLRYSHLDPTNLAAAVAVL
jgi:integrase